MAKHVWSYDRASKVYVRDRTAVQVTASKVTADRESYEFMFNMTPDEARKAVFDGYDRAIDAGYDPTT